MSLLLFLIGLFIIFCIGRYNESNKLFWILLISFISSFAITSVAIKAALGKGKKVSCVSLTQAPASKSGIFLLADYALAGTQVLYNTKPVGKGTLCSLCNFTEDSSCSGINDVSIKMIKPPQNTSYFDDS